jgi:hypothetical protein
MTDRGALTRPESSDHAAASVLAEALVGRRLGRRQCRQLAATLRLVTEALPPSTGDLSGRSRRLAAAANILNVSGSDGS